VYRDRLFRVRRQVGQPTADRSQPGCDAVAADLPGHDGVDSAADVVVYLVVFCACGAHHSG
jgi:hypothetical protein